MQALSAPGGGEGAERSCDRRMREAGGGVARAAGPPNLGIVADRWATETGRKS